MPPPPQDPADEVSFAFDIGPKKRVQVKNFKGQVIIDIREFFEREQGGGGLLPTKKGVTLNIEMWNKLNEVRPEIDKVIMNLEKLALTKNMENQSMGDSSGGNDYLNFAK